MEANGSTKMIRLASLTELKRRKSRKKIAAIVSGTITDKVSMARSRFSNWPPNLK
jgi:hypothetical protein